MKIEAAQKNKQKLKIALSGISGSGKTYSALILAFSMCNKVCVIDTECGSASLYSKKFPPYKVINLSAPYSPQRYLEAIRMAEKDGFECIIVDSLSHEWNGSGGCLNMVQSVGGNSYTAWAKVTPHHDNLINAMISSRSHVIVTMRSKAAYDISSNDKGKMAPIKIGMAPTQRDGVEYEFTMVFDLDQNNKFTCSKDRTSLFRNVDIPETLDATVGEKILEWLEDGVEIVQEQKEIKSNVVPITESMKEKSEFKDRFTSSATILKQKCEKAHEVGDMEVLNVIKMDWFCLCNDAMKEIPDFVVWANVAEKMHNLLGIESATSIKQGKILFSGGEIVILDDILPKKESVKEGVE